MRTAGVKSIKKFPRELISELKKTRVVTVYLFGSQANKTAGPLSDYDIAVLLNRHVAKNRYLDIRLEFMRDFSSFFKTQAEVIILNEAPPLLAMNVIEDGIILYDADSSSRVDFETKTTMRYLDRLPYERRHLKNLIAAV